MPNPSIVPLLPDQLTYTVNNSKDVTIDLYLSDLANGAEFTLQCPMAATVNLIQVSSAVPAALSTTAPTHNTSIPARTVDTTVAVAGTIDITVVAGNPANEYWQLK